MQVCTWKGYAVMMTALTHSRYSVLITDDDRGSREAIQDGLEGKGYRTIVASCGRETIQIVRRELVHVMIIDMHMPDLTGIETLRMIKQVIDAPPPCILMSAEVSKELMINAMMAHAHTVLQKPLSLEIIRMVLEELIERYYPESG